MDDALVVKINFPEGDLDFIRVLIKTDTDSVFETWIGIGLDVIPALGKVSAELFNFDMLVHSYAEDMDEFWNWVRNGADDFEILDYERKDYGA